jgi:hypothetical protein
MDEQNKTSFPLSAKNTILHASDIFLGSATKKAKETTVPVRRRK